jgi:hypothetical protein
MMQLLLYVTMVASWSPMMMSKIDRQSTMAVVVWVIMKIEVMNSLMTNVMAVEMS